MPWPWIGFPTGPWQAPKPTQPVIDGQLVVTSLRKSADPIHRVIKFEGGVEALYGVERVGADTLEIHLAPGESWGTASGHVHLLDPDGTVEADTLKFSWRTDSRYGQATNALVKVAGVTIRAKSAEVKPGLWTLHDFQVTNDPHKPPLYSMSGKTLTINPGKRAVIGHPSFSLLGHKVLTLKSIPISLDPRATGIRPPNIEYRAGSGFGMNWTGGLFLKDDTNLEWHADTFPGSRPGYGTQLTRTWVPPEHSYDLVAPRSDLAERFAFGFFENVQVLTPQSERSYLSELKSAASVSTLFNAGVDGRGAPDEGFSEPLQLIYESGGPSGKFSHLTDLRLQSIESQSSRLKVRAQAQSSLYLPSLSLSRDLYTQSRLDSALFQSGNTFGWSRFTAGLVYEPHPRYRLSAAVVGAVQGGTADFDIDPLYATNGFSLRADANFGATKLSYMLRYDTARHWFDREYYLTQAAGPLEVYVVYRRYPEDYRFGVRLRVDQFQDLLKRRQFRRPSEAKSGNAP